ncbi:MAG: DUF2085 domain-containing protein [Byssovorax sp.]
MTGTWNRRATLWMARASFGSITLWIAITTALRAAGGGLVWTALDLPFRLVCHRIPERVISIAGTPMPLCSRCAGLWIGASISAACAWPVLSLRALRIVLPIAMVLLGIEVLTQDLGLHPVFHPTRLLSGLLVSVPLGGAIGGMITRELGRGAEGK